ncbi:phage tail sheath C-terminal domain-containing protein [Flexivirga alba]|uniref:Phage tail sheath C-terminal domain-containing protein n=1 Tax=Flexivirga alba TaxID=702742 RepID=A0ABW2AFV4_9MICO
MPEYLAPGVYVEEIDTGSKPIEGVSTSTCGVVGVAERGPTDVPILITSVGDFTRTFGGLLRADDYGEHRFLPHAIEGFFTNGGKRVYAVRVVDAAASRAATSLFYPGTAAPVPSVLVRPAGEGTGTAANLPELLALPGSGLAPGDWVRVGDGSGAEYRQVAAAPTANTTMVPLALPLARSHPAGEPVEEYVRAVTLGFTLPADVAAGAELITVQGAHADVAALSAGDCLEFGAAPTAEYRTVRETTATTVVSPADSTTQVRIDSGVVLSHPGSDAVSRVDLSAGAVTTAAVGLATGGSATVFVDDTQGAFTDRTHLVRVGTPATAEVGRIGELDKFEVAPATGGYDAGTLVQAVQPAADRTLTANVAIGDTTLTLQAGETAGLVTGQRVVLDPAGSPETLTITSIDAGADTLTLTPAAAAAHTAPAAVVPRDSLTTAVTTAGGAVAALDDRIGIGEDSVLRIGAGTGAQIVTVVSLPALSGVAPDPGTVVVSPSLTQGRPAGAAVTRLGAVTAVAGRQACVLALPAPAGDGSLLLSDGDGFAAGDLLRLTTAAEVSYVAVTAAPAAPAAPVQVPLQTALARAHPAGSMLVERTPLIDIQALDAGSWGNRLRISVQDETPGLVTSTLATMVNATTIRLASASGVEAGTVLELTDPATGTVLGDPVKVSSINRSAQNAITLAGSGLSAAQQVIGAGVRSREFGITVRLLRQPDPNVPSRDSQVIDLEAYRNVSLDPRHSNYVEKAIGSITGPLRKSDHRPEGTSLYLRVADVATTDAVRQSVRLGPETLVDVLPDGRVQPALLRLETTPGDDSIGTISDDTYIGADNADPEQRTGLQSLRNVDEISLVAIPGRVSARLQQAVIDHCELLRYRFAVLDTTPEPDDTISDAQSQRAQFDTEYAALYYPWLSIPDPFPTNLADIHDYAIPPAGHVLGVYARTDIDRGVHKAPANEVVGGITGLRRSLNKAEQDILNPYPVNVNVIRDFRDNNRGIRVYGARVITSDPDWKYVNVRRLLIFIEASLDRGLQWVVFEPNADPLWARVRRVIANFLTTVWRSGALEGTKVEEAFFVKCDRTTMTQTDIDNGRLIVVIGVAPVKPAEFVIVRIGLWTAHADN